MMPACLFTVSPKLTGTQDLIYLSLDRPQTPKVGKDDLELLICLPPPPECWEDCRVPIMWHCEPNPEPCTYQANPPQPQRCFSLKGPSKPDIVAHLCKPEHRRLRREDCFVSEVSLGFTMSSRTAWTTVYACVSRNQNK